MEHWLILIHAAGDLIYLIAALITLAAAVTDRTTHRSTDPIE
jgi:hypothetical protein